jgi:type II secretory pathway pseudopilin PulG
MDRNSSRGYILAMLLAIIVAMGILLTAALPSLTAEIQRDQEAELIYRGEAMAAAIRTYRAKTGGYPLNLEDLTKVRPPILRKLYLDPMTHEGEWELITAVQPGASGDKTGLPIVGVKSRCQKDSYKVYQGKTLISDWAFSAAGNLLGTPGVGAAAAVLGATGTTSTTGTDPSQLTGAAPKTTPNPANPPPAAPPATTP